jgi:hypothetical protein
MGTTTIAKGITKLAMGVDNSYVATDVDNSYVMTDVDDVIMPVATIFF